MSLSEDAGARRGGSGSVRAGWAMSGLVILFLLVDAAMKLAQLPLVTETSAQLGWPSDSRTTYLLGAVLLGSTLLHALPRTAMLGALLLTGYLGGAVATHVRIGSPLFSHVLFGVYIGILVWGGLWLRDPRVRALLPLRR
ncbi:MAG: DoxX family protein [Allosphingosinicella sp.]